MDDGPDGALDEYVFSGEEDENIFRTEADKKQQNRKRLEVLRKKPSQTQLADLAMR